MASQILEISFWSDFVSVMTLKQLPMMYQEFPDRYEIYAIEAVLWHITLLKTSSDCLNFEKYYKVNANTGNYYQGIRISDSVGNFINTPTEGNLRGIAVVDVDLQIHIRDVVNELKKIRAHFEHMTGLEFSDEDVEEL